MSQKTKVIDSTVPTFITTTVVDWVDLFAEPVYCNILDKSLNCRKKKRIEVCILMFMSHIHLIITALDGECKNVDRDSKQFTSKNG
jgi:hypothetical protein